MALTGCSGDDPRMDEELRAPRIVIRVSPRVLGDVLSIALRDEGLEVIVYTEERAGEVVDADGPFDLALVSDLLADDVEADVTIVLDDAGESVLFDEGNAPLEADDRLSSLIAKIESVLRHGAQ